MKKRIHLLLLLALLASLAGQPASAHNAAGTDLVVTSAGDELASGDGCTLREAMLNANRDDQSGSRDCPAGSGADTITFRLGNAREIWLHLPLPPVSGSLHIQGPGETALALSGGWTVPVLSVAENGRLVLEQLSVINGKSQAGDGAGLTNKGYAEVRQVTFRGNQVESGLGGAIANRGTLAVASARFTSNRARQGGAIYSSGTLSVKAGRFEQNQAAQGGAIAITGAGGKATVEASHFYSNTATFQGGAIHNTFSLVMNTSWLEGNEAPEGGAVANVAGAFTSSQNAYLGNRAGWGSALANTAAAISTEDDFENNQGSAAGNRGRLTLNWGLFRQNRAEDGAALHNAGVLIVRNSRLLKNTASRLGPALFNTGSYLLEQSTLAQNDAAEAGAVYQQSGAGQVTSSLFSLNAFAGLAVISGTLNVAQSEFRDQRGPGLDNAGAAWVERSGFYGNRRGGLVNTGVLTLTASTLSGNAAEWGGGLRNGGRLWAVNVTLYNNRAELQGGGLYNAGEITATHVTVAGNTAGEGGGLYAGTQSYLAMRNSLIARNTAANCRLAPGLRLPADTLASDASCPGARITRPDELALGPFGLYQQWPEVVPLLPGSAAIDAGNPAFCAAFDQRGQPRPTGLTCDLGAFESCGYRLWSAGGDRQQAFVTQPFTQALQLRVASLCGDPLVFGRLAVSAPTEGASARLVGDHQVAGNPVVVTLGGPVAQPITATARVAVTANAIIGTYPVTVTMRGAFPLFFRLTNLPKP